MNSYKGAQRPKLRALIQAIKEAMTAVSVGA
jgi:hypothetical protein